MRDKDKTKEQLISELAEMRQRIAALEDAAAEWKRQEETLRQEQELLDALMNTAQDSIYFKDRQFRLTRVSRKMIQDLNLDDVSQAIGKTDRELFDEELGSRTMADEMHIMATGEPLVDIIEEWRLPDGRINWTSTTKVPLRDAKGEIVGIMGITREINERIQMEETLRRERYRAQKYLDVVGVMVMVLNERGEVILINRKGCQVLGYAEEAIVGRNWFDTCLPAQIRKDVKSVFQRLMAGETGLVKYYENPVLTSSGEQRIIAWHNIVLTDEAGKIAGALSSGEDVTERKRAEDEQTARIRRVQRQQTATAKLAVHEAIVAGDFEQAARVITETASQAMEVERVGVWLLSGDRAELRCVDLFERTSVAHSEGMVLQASDCPRYFEAFETGVVIDAHDALADPRTNEFTEEHLLPLGITSMLDVAIRAQGEVVGVVCHEHVGEPRQWRTDEITFAGGVSDQMALALLNAERRQVGMERELLLAQIREQARRVQQIIDTVPEGVLLLDADRRIILANPMAEKELAALASVAVGDVITHLAGQPVEELLTSPPKGLWHELAINGRSFQIIARPTEASDFTVIGLAETGPVSSGWVLVIRDVTQQREIERRVHQRDKLVAVGQLAAGIAHDFNNIMATIVLYAQMTARTSGLPNRVQDWMATIDQQAKHATDLIRQILDFGRRAALERRPLDLVPFLKEQVQMLKRILPENIDIGLVYGPNEYVINADLTGIQQIVMNLAVNARDAMPEGGRLRIELERMRVESRGEAPLPEMEVGDWVQVTVSDTGVGIPSDVLPYIFDPFFTTKALGEGTGLGLAQVHGIVGSHGGFMDVKTQVGQGTAFIIYLPALLMHSSEPSVVASFAGPLSLVKGHGETILVVEDNATARRALVESLEQLNYQVLEAANGQDALDILERHASAAGHDVAQIALVVSDVVMPEMSGIALLRSMKDRGLIVGVLLLTGHPLERELEDLRAQRAASLLIDWLPKPPSLEQLAAVVARGVKKHPVDL